MHGRCVRAFLAAMLLGGLYAAPAPAATRNFIALLNAGQEAQATPVDSNAFGVAFLTFNDKTLALCYSITFFSPSTLETAAHIHGPAAPGTSAPVIVGLNPVPGNPKNGCVNLPAKNKKDLKRSMTYVNVHTTRFGQGEIRGQVIPVK